METGTENQAAGSDRALAAYALGDDFDLAQALEIVAADAVSVPATIAAYEGSLAPLKAVEPKLNGDGSRALEDALKPIGAKIAPHLSVEQARTWRTAMVVALSDLSTRTALRATRDAVHTPMQFLSEAEGAIRAKAAEIDERHQNAIWRLRRLQREIAEASKPKLEAPEGWQDGQTAPLSDDEIRRTPKHVLRLGMTAGHITAQQIEAAGVCLTDESRPEAA